MAAQKLILDRYRVKGVAGSGGYAPVLRAYDTNLKRDVAIKVIELSESEVARARILAMEDRLQADLGSIDVDDEFTGTLDDVPPTATSAEAGYAGVDHAGVGYAGDLEEDELAESDLFDHIPGLQEARMTARLADENIVTVHDCVLSGNTAYVIMEYVEGKTLAQLIDESGDLMTLDAIAAVFDSVAHALEVAHAGEILHLDVKPDNVMVNAKGVVKVTDFGLATLVDANGRGTTGGGTIGYMPLEQMRQQSLDERTDEWSLASLAYELLSGENPFFAEDLASAEEAIEEAELVLPSLCWDDVDPAIDDIIFTALDINPDGRYRSVSAFADELSPYLGDPKRGQRQLANMVKGLPPQESPMPKASQVPTAPLAERLSDRMLFICTRTLSLLGASATTALALANIQIGEGSSWGLATSFTPVFWGVLIAIATAGALWPSLGTLLSLIALAVALMSNGAYLLGVGLLVASATWWYFTGRNDDLQPCLISLHPLLGAVGFAALTPVLAGCFMSVRNALPTALFAVFLSLVLASFGSCDLMGWNGLVNLRFASLNVQGAFLATVTQLQTWCVGASWMLATLVIAAFCMRERKAFDVAGAALGAAILLAGACAGAAADAGSLLGGASSAASATSAATAAVNVASATSWLPSVSSLIGSLFPGVVGILIAGFGYADRARWADDETEPATETG